MPYKALFLGSIGVLADTSEMQRAAFNAAFMEAGLAWDWAQGEYREMLSAQGGRARIEAFARARGEIVDVDALYAGKKRAFERLMQRDGAPLRAGIADTVSEAKASGMARAFVTSTARAQVDAVFDGLGGALTRADFDYVGEAALVAAPKPATDIYAHALAALGFSAPDVLCVEDTPESADAALRAGLNVVGFPGGAAYGRAFPDGVPVVEFLSPMILAGSALGLAAE